MDTPHTHTHSHTHTQTHKHTHTQCHIITYAITNAYTYIRAQTHADSPTHTSTDVRHSEKRTSAKVHRSSLTPLLYTPTLLLFLFFLLLRFSIILPYSSSSASEGLSASSATPVEPFIRKHLQPMKASASLASTAAAAAA